MSEYREKYRKLALCRLDIFERYELHANRVTIINFYNELLYGAIIYYDKYLYKMIRNNMSNKNINISCKNRILFILAKIHLLYPIKRLLQRRELIGN